MSREEVPGTPAGPGLFVMGNTTGLPQQQRARGRIRRPADDAPDGGAQPPPGEVRDEEAAEGQGATTGAARREANQAANASATTSLLGGPSPSKRAARGAKTIKDVGYRFKDICMCRDRKFGTMCKS